MAVSKESVVPFPPVRTVFHVTSQSFYVLFADIRWKRMFEGEEGKTKSFPLCFTRLDLSLPNLTFRKRKRMKVERCGRTREGTWILATLCIVSLFVFLGETFFNTRGSSREAVVALTMLKDGNWILPVNNGVDMAYKPPFTHWLIALISLPFGHVTEYTSRLPSALALSVMTMACFRFFAKREDAGTSLLAAMLLLTSFETHRAGMSCRVDMVLTCMMVLALLQLFKWTERGMRGIPWWGVLWLGCAFLSKGPVGAVLPCLVVLVYALSKGFGWERSFSGIVSIGLLSCILPLAWYVAAWRQGGDRFLELVYEENVLRLLGKMSYESHVNPWYYNVMTVTAGFLPYTFLAVMSLAVLPWRRMRQPLHTLWRKFVLRLRAMDDARLFSLLSFVIIFVFYCIPKSKRSVYLLPTYPFLAWFLAEYMTWLWRQRRRTVACFGWVMSMAAIALTVTYFLVKSGVINESLIVGGHPEEMHGMLAALRGTPATPLQKMVLLLPLISAGMFVYDSIKGRNLLLSAIRTVFCITLALDGFYQPLLLNTKSDKPVAEAIARIQPVGRIYSFRTDITPGNPMHPFTINFYLGDRVAPFEAFMPARGYVIIGNDEAAEFCRRYPQYNLTERVNFNRRSCDDHKIIHLYHFSRR